MLAVEKALEIVLSRCRPQPAQMVPLSGDLSGRVLAEDINSDIDMPPFDKAMMDGYAVRASDIGDGSATLPVAATLLAGQEAPALPANHAIRIMTGAPIPAGADAVVRVEETESLDGERVKFATRPPRPGQFILERGREMRVGNVVLPTGTVLTPQVIGLLATVGRTSAKLVAAPSVAVLATGDELVEAGQKPGPTQLRNSNGPMLVAQSRSARAATRYLGIARDEREELASLIQTGMQESILILSGGVSMGQRDLVPNVLQEMRVESHVHHIAMKPGKPFFFGTRGDTLVFGLPGNPVSSFCCFELFVRPAIRRLAGHTDSGPTWQQASLAEPFDHSSDRPTYHPAVLNSRAGVSVVAPVAWFGSPDLRALSRANALMLLPVGRHALTAGTQLPTLRLE